MHRELRCSTQCQLCPVELCLSKHESHWTPKTEFLRLYPWPAVVLCQSKAAATGRAGSTQTLGLPPAPAAATASTCCLATFTATGHCMAACEVRRMGKRGGFVPTGRPMTWRLLAPAAANTRCRQHLQTNCCLVYSSCKRHQQTEQSKQRIAGDVRCSARRRWQQLARRQSNPNVCAAKSARRPGGSKLGPAGCAVVQRRERRVGRRRKGGKNQHHRGSAERARTSGNPAGGGEQAGRRVPWQQPTKCTACCPSAAASQTCRTRSRHRQKP